MERMKKMKIGFIGLGNMASAMIGGMLEQKVVIPEEIIGSDLSAEMKKKAEETFGIGTFSDNRQVAAQSQVIVLAVKPIFLSEVIQEIKAEITEDKLVISIAAGKSISWIEEEFGRSIKLIRCMPNTPALVSAGCTAVCKNGQVSDEEEALCLKLMGSFGKAIAIPERLMDAAMAVGSMEITVVLADASVAYASGVWAGCASISCLMRSAASWVEKYSVRSPTSGEEK